MLCTTVDGLVNGAPTRCAPYPLSPLRMTEWVPASIENGKAMFLPYVGIDIACSGCYSIHIVNFID